MTFEQRVGKDEPIRDVQVVYGESASIYHASLNVSNSMVTTLINDGPTVYFSRFVERTEASTKDWTKISIADVGTLTHMALLEPERFSEAVRIIPEHVLGKDGRRSTTDYKAWCDMQPDGVWLLREADLDRVHAMRDSAMRNRRFRSMLEKYDGEVSIYWDDDGMPRKARIDLPSDHGLCDIKTTGRGRPRDFVRHARTMGWIRQACYYAEAFQAWKGEHPVVGFCVISSEPPHDVGFFQFSEEDIAAARMELNAALEELRVRYQHAYWANPWEESLFILPPHGGHVHDYLDAITAAAKRWSSSGKPAETK